MPVPRKFDEETRARAVRLHQNRLRDRGESKLAARWYVGELLDISPARMRLAMQTWTIVMLSALRPSKAAIASRLVPQLIA